MNFRMKPREYGTSRVFKTSDEDEILRFSAALYQVLAILQRDEFQKPLVTSSVPAPDTFSRFTLDFLLIMPGYVYF